ncbi:D-3-phosphoglycerate dehydrogenase [Artemisia annua]|uniref:D-3-phosphoglycerate dehydrogenase n=1 Tax=Artemisia annua TaxID=35608 RepID=A0A2U1N9Q3_ARTAN|nr:D-3-phosphoglycerate dehydrogenase [Artemisia annua]
MTFVADTYRTVSCTIGSGWKWCWICNTISRVTSILGEENASINLMSAGRPVMMIGIDKKPSKEALKKIDEIPGVEEFAFLAL